MVKCLSNHVATILAFCTITWLKKLLQVLALAGVAQWTERRPANWKVTGLTPSQDTYLSCGPGSQLGTWERQPHSDVCLPLFLPPFPSL